jgi:hypothetical protein
LIFFFSLSLTLPFIRIFIVIASQLIIRFVFILFFYYAKKTFRCYNDKKISLYILVPEVEIILVPEV